MKTETSDCIIGRWVDSLTSFRNFRKTCSERVTTIEIPKTLQAKSQVQNVVERINNLNSKSNLSEIIKTGNNVKLEKY